MSVELNYVGTKGSNQQQAETFYKVSNTVEETFPSAERQFRGKTQRQNIPDIERRRFRIVGEVPVNSWRRRRGEAPGKRI
jgi:hypothetical protein